MTSDLLLDSQIRDWVLLPIVVVLVILAMFRHYLAKWQNSGVKKVNLKQVREGQILLRAKRLQFGANTIPLESFVNRRAIFTGKNGGLLLMKKDPNPLNNPMFSNPAVAMDGMKSNLTNIVIQPLVMSWVSYFFTGFVLVKIPFPMTLRFKGMLQRGVELDSLDVAYVSSLSWYFLVLFGLMGVNSLLLGEDDAGAMTMVDPMMAQAQAFAASPAMDTATVFTAEKDNLDLVQHRFFADADLEAELMAQPDFSL